jgi:transposase
VRPVLIVMLHIIVYDAFKLAAAEDEQPVESIPGVGCRPSARREAALGGEQLASLALHPHAKAQSERLLRLIAALEEEMAELEGELCRLARTDSPLRALQTIWAVGPILACHLRAEIGDASPLPARPPARPRRRTRPSRTRIRRQQTRRPTRQNRLPQLRWALVEAAQHACRNGSPELELYHSVRERAGAQRATLTAARTIARRCFHTLTTAPEPA